MINFNTIDRSIDFRLIAPKIVRIFIVSLCFLCLGYIAGMPMRQSQQVLFGLSTIILLSLVMENVWLTLFMIWSVILFIFFKLNLGAEYIQQIMFGSIIYLVTKKMFRKDHIDFYLKGMLVLLGLNLGYMVLQKFGLDFIYRMIVTHTDGTKDIINTSDPAGFMGFKACMGVLISMCIPVLMTRRSKILQWATVGLVVPLYLLQASMAVATSVIVAMFTLHYKGVSIKKIVIVGLILCMLAGAYIILVDMPMGTLSDRIYVWKLVLHDCIVHPVVGWGLDSFRNYTQQKQHVYGQNATKLENGDMHFDFWDNPHNLYISLFFEWGGVGILLFLGYLRMIFFRFKNGVKCPNTIALAGMILAFLLASTAQFPIFLARCAVFIIPMFALYEVQTT